MYEWLKYSPNEKLDFNWIKDHGRNIIVLIEDIKSICHTHDFFNHEVDKKTSKKISYITDEKQQEIIDKFYSMEKVFNLLDQNNSSSVKEKDSELKDKIF